MVSIASAALAAAAVIYFDRSYSTQPVAAAGDDNASQLNGVTKYYLQNLSQPVQVRFYSLLDDATTPESVRAYSRRVDQLLSQYENAAGGKLTVLRTTVLTPTNANAALADGIQVFDLDKGEGSYLGVAVVSGKAKEQMASLSPDWEPALESDLTRLIASTAAEGKVSVPAPASDSTAIASVQKLIPNVSTVSVADGTKAIRSASLVEFKKAVEEMQARTKAAESRFLAADAAQSEDGKVAARKELDQIQAEHLVRLRQLTDGTQAQLNALTQLKAGAN
jgi:hypothetical protein